MKLAKILRNKRVIITVGAGGVGKTTMAAAIGLWLAIVGRKVMVVTIDPARRLASALGLHQIGGKPHTIDLRKIQSSPRGELVIMMLDSAAVFRDLIRRTLSSHDHQERVLSNRFFVRFTEAMGGTQEHAAIEKLYELVESDYYDVIVLDTPPSQHAIDFLNAPDRLLNVLDDSVIRWLVKPATSGLSMVSFGGKYTAKILSLFTGADFLIDLTEFISLMSGELAGFRERADSVRSLLHDDRTAYLAVASPERHAMEGALMFSQILTQQLYPMSGLIMNRIWRVPDQPLTKDLLKRLLKKSYPGVTFPPNFETRSFLSYIHRVNVARIHRLKVDQLIANTALDLPVFEVPALTTEIDNLNSIYSLAKQLFQNHDSREQFREVRDSQDR